MKQIDRYRRDCAVCGAPLVYTQGETQRTCAGCGKRFFSNTGCANGHFLCDACHEAPAVAAIRVACLAQTQPRPVALANQLMAHTAVHVHGPEHHFLVPAVLLTACHATARRRPGLDAALTLAWQRARQVPGGACGYLGACGGGVGGGIFVSVLTHADPLSGRAWGLANALTARVLARLAQIGGPRCCKRAVYAALEQAAPFVREHLPAFAWREERILCRFFSRNRECKREKCPYYPAGDTENRII